LAQIIGKEQLDDAKGLDHIGDDRIEALLHFAQGMSLSMDQRLFLSAWSK